MGLHKSARIVGACALWSRVRSFKDQYRNPCQVQFCETSRNVMKCCVWNNAVGQTLLEVRYIGDALMIGWFRRRYLDLLGSIYIYNEHRGYTAIDRVLEAVRARAPEDAEFIAAIEKHRADERKHYMMFRRWFELRGVMPFAVDRTCGHIDRFVEIMFGSTIDGLNTVELVARDDLFERLCRVIALTERRGYRQVDTLLKHPLVRGDKALIKIFRIIEKDEPSHWAPYERWLRTNGKRDPRWWEHAIDSFVHSELLFIKLPALFLTPRLTRSVAWADASELRDVRARPDQLLAAG